MLQSEITVKHLRIFRHKSQQGTVTRTQELISHSALEQAVYFAFITQTITPTAQVPTYSYVCCVSLMS